MRSGSGGSRMGICCSRARTTGSGARRTSSARSRRSSRSTARSSGSRRPTTSSGSRSSSSTVPTRGPLGLPVGPRRTPSGAEAAVATAAGVPVLAAATAASEPATAGSSQLIEIVFLLLVASTVLAVVARRIAVPYPVLLVLGGLALGLVPGLPRPELEPDIVFLLFLPPILFAAGYFTSIRDLRHKAQPIALLAVGLVLFTTVVVAVVVHTLVPEMSWAASFALGAIVAPPDAVAATTIFQRLGVPRRIVVVLEGESLLNDATALIAYRLAVGVATGTAVFSVVDASTSFVVSAVGGVAVGLLVGAVVAW